jgi:hypothetical protein
MAHEVLTPEQRAAVLAGTVEERLAALGCPAGLAKRGQQLFEKRSAAQRKPTVTKPTTAAPDTADTERVRKAAVIAVQIGMDRAKGDIS